ncbi:MAG: hypothetical protein QG650_414 [Patescibacteria group bacterium]|nr:hypothetical protein [Patescibacteria group bacterium]
MASKRTLRATFAFLEIATVTAACVFSGDGTFPRMPLAVPSASAEEGFVSEDLGLDLYRKVDQGVGKLKDMMAEKRIPGNAKKLNERIGKECLGPSDAGPPKPTYCLEEGKDFTLEELNAIEAGSAAPIFSRLASDVRPETDGMTKIMSAAKSFVGVLKAEAGDQTETLGRIGSIGLFTDGSLDNSSYDLMKYLENINSVIFVQDIPYDGNPNDGAQTVMSFAQAVGFPSSIDPFVSENPAGDNGIDFRPPTYLGSFSGRITSSGLEQSSLCADGTSVKGLDAALARDIERQLSYGSNAGTAGTPEELSRYVPTNAPSAARPTAGSKPDNKTSKFPCVLFFCIRTDFVMYESFLLGGSKTYTVENILDENYKIAKKFAGSSFVQAQHTNNFFELLLKNLNLPNLMHLGVVVQTMPPPILNVKGGDTPRGEPKTSSEEKEFKEVTEGTFKDFGIRYDKQNVIDDLQVAQCLRNSEDISTNDVTNRSKCSPTPVPMGNYAFSKESGIRQSYSDSFSNDLQEMRGFTQTFTDSILNVGSLSKKFSEIPKGR